MYDTLVDVPPAVREAAVFIRQVLEDYAEAGRPLWPPIPSSLHAAFLVGNTSDSRVVLITWDSSIHGLGVVIRWWANPEGKVVVGTLPHATKSPP